MLSFFRREATMPLSLHRELVAVHESAAERARIEARDAIAAARAEARAMIEQARGEVIAAQERLLSFAMEQSDRFAQLRRDGFVAQGAELPQMPELPPETNPLGPKTLAAIRAYAGRDRVLLDHLTAQAQLLAADEHNDDAAIAERIRKGESRR